MPPHTMVSLIYHIVSQDILTRNLPMFPVLPHDRIRRGKACRRILSCFLPLATIWAPKLATKRSFCCPDTVYLSVTRSRPAVNTNAVGTTAGALLELMKIERMHYCDGLEVCCTWVILGCRFSSLSIQERWRGETRSEQWNFIHKDAGRMRGDFFRESMDARGLQDVINVLDNVCLERKLFHIVSLVLSVLNPSLDTLFNLQVVRGCL